MNNQQVYLKIIEVALTELVESATDLTKIARQQGCSLRLRRFIFAKQAHDFFAWPYHQFTGEAPGDDAHLMFYCSHTSCNGISQRRLIAKHALDLCGYQPRRILQTLQRIRVATAWCERRIASLKQIESNKQMLLRKL